MNAILQRRGDEGGLIIIMSTHKNKTKKRERYIIFKYQKVLKKNRGKKTTKIEGYLFWIIFFQIRFVKEARFHGYHTDGM